MSELKPCPFCGESKLLYSGGCGFRYDDDDNQIRLFRVHCRTCKGRTGLFESLDEAVEAWNRRTNSTTIQPSAQPEQSIAEWQKDFREYINMLNIPRDDYKGIMEYINEVPSAQPEPFTVNLNDTLTPEQIERWKMQSLELLPKSEQCEDAVSRVGAISHFRAIADATYPKEKYNEGFVDGLEFCIAHLSTMPSVTPKQRTGKWIDVDVMGMPAQACDQCNTFYPLAYTGGGHHFCPNCGADMRGEKDG